jgi:MEMO1 family protein
MKVSHVSPYAGDWYPASRPELARVLEERFAASARRIGSYFPPDALGFVVPHAAPAWSGTVAAAAYRAIETQKPEQVILLAFPHRGGLGRVATPAVDAISTPLGSVSIDRSFESAFPPAPESRLCDHSFEIQLPFLQRAAPPARITPLYIGAIDAGQRQAAADLLAAAWRPGVVFVASSDFTHYGRAFGFEPFPNDSHIESSLRDLDFDCIDAAGGLDAEHFLAALDRNRATVCGTAPIALLLDVLRRIDSQTYQTTLDYQVSGGINSDFSHSVSYAALGYYRSSSFALDAADGQALLTAAAETLEQLRRSGKGHPIPPRSASAALTSRRGVFVTLRHEGDLLGCVGNASGRNSLARDVPELTLAAATEDPRFRPATETHGAIDIELSILTPLRPIRRAEEFRLGRHGAMLALGGRSGLLLPQVAVERGWSAEEFWRALARKSGLWPEAWRDPKARLWVFETQRIER